MNAAQPGRRRVLALAVVVGTVTAAVVAADLGAAPERPASGPACGGTLWRLLTFSDASAKSVVKKLPRSKRERGCLKKVRILKVVEDWMLP